MLLATVVISATLLAATTLAGLLMVNQIRQSANAEQSARAIFAADAGLEHQLYQFYKEAPDCSIAPPDFSNNSEVDTKMEREGSDVVIKSVGTSGRASRSFLLNLGPLDQPICFELEAEE